MTTFSIDNNSNTLNYISTNILKLEIFRKYNKNINNLSKPKIIIFDDRCKFNKNMNNLPFTLEELYFSCWSIYNNSLYKLPNTIKTIKLGDNFTKYNTLPNNIKTLIIGDINKNDNLDMLPEGLKTIIFIGNIKKTINDLPSSIKKIYVDSLYNDFTDINKIYHHKIQNHCIDIYTLFKHYSL